jgi:hypothetical protein
LNNSFYDKNIKFTKFLILITDLTLHDKIFEEKIDFLKSFYQDKAHHIQNIESKLEIQQNSNLHISSQFKQYQYYLHSSPQEVSKLQFLISRNS